MKTLKEEFLEHYKDIKSDIFKICKIDNTGYYIVFKTSNVYAFDRVYFKDINDDFKLIMVDKSILSKIEQNYFNLLIPFVDKLKLKIKLEEKLENKNIKEEVRKI